MFSPALVLFSFYDSKIGEDELTILLLIAVFQIVMAAISYVTMRLYGTNRMERTAVMISSFCLNEGNFGLSIAHTVYRLLSAP